MKEKKKRMKEMSVEWGGGGGGRRGKWMTDADWPDVFPMMVMVREIKK